MIIDQLPALVTAGDNDEIAIEVGTTTYKIKKSDFLKEFMPKSGGEFTGNVTVGGVIDVTKRRASVSLPGAGWYRVLTFAAGSDAFARGATGHELVFHITRRRTTAGEETHEIKMLCQYDNVSFVDEVSKSIPNYQRITKIRYTYDGTNGYVDIYASGASAYVTVDFEVYCAPSYQSLYASGGLVDVPASGTGTVMTEYSFTENIPESGSGYSKNPDGTMIQWGDVSGLSFSNQNMITGTTTLPQAFVNTSYTVVIIPWYTGVNVYILRVGASPNTTDSFNWSLGSGDSTNVTASGRGFKYLAVGRWK